MFGISKNVKYIAVAPGASKLPALKKVRPCRGLNPGCPCSLVNIENEEEFGVYSEQKTDLLLEKSFMKSKIMYFDGRARTAKSCREMVRNDNSALDSSAILPLIEHNDFAT